MRISDITPDDCSPDLRVRIEKVMAKEGLSWKGALVFLAQKVVSPVAYAM